ncbi:MAG: Gfo/Idh/MocA family oxidoreductase [Anaerolineales bacterium]|nr:Gfo/Idh/MocA family oxidoreductase [Anaerolineales bacterium]
MSDLRVGLIGCGNIAARAHAPALHAIEGLQVVGVCDPTPARRLPLQMLFDLPAAASVADYRQLLDLGLDYVTVTTPQQFRRPIIEACAAAGVHVLTEKPIATVPADAAAMVAAMRAANLRYGMCHNYLFFPEFILARELIRSGAIGRLGHVHLSFLGLPDHPGAAEYRPRWRHDAAEAGGGILMDIVHALYLSEWFLDSPARAVSAVVDNLTHPGESVEDFTLVHLSGDQGYTTVQLWWGGGANGFEFSGSAGRILLFYQDYATGPFADIQSFTLVNSAGRQEFTPRGPRPEFENFIALHTDFAEAVRTGRDPLAPAETGRRTMEAVLAAYLSAATERVVRLPLPADSPLYLRGVAGLAEMAPAGDSPVHRAGILGLKPPA